MDEQGQGALEYLLLIGGSILIVLIVLAILRAGPLPSARSQIASGVAAYNQTVNYSNLSLS